MNFVRESGLPYPQPWEWIRDNIKFKRSNNLFFVDVGANDGLCCSNSAYFEFDLGWGGICIEPHPTAFKKLQESRKSILYNCCISTNESDVDFLLVHGYAEMLSGIYSAYDYRHIDRINSEISIHGGSKELFKIQSKKLSRIFEENYVSYIDYLSIDVECGELEVLKSIDFSAVEIEVISAEHNGYNDNVREFLESVGYKYLRKICGDEIYAK